MSTLSELIPSGGTQNNIEFVAQGTLANGQTVALRSDGKVEAVAGVAGSVGSIVAYGSTNQNEIAATYDSTNNKVVLTALNGSGYGTATVGTVSGSSISFGSPVVFNSGGTLFINIGFDSSNSKVVIAYQDQGNGGYGTAIVGTVSGTSISFGSEVVFKTSDATSNAVAFDSNSNKIVITYVGGASTYAGYAVVGTVSGTSISFGSEATWRGANSYSAERGSATFDTLTNQIIVVQRVSGNTGRVCVGAVSGTSISFGSAAQIGSGTAYTPSVSYDSNNNKVVIAYKDGNNSNYGTAIVGTVSGNGITLGTAAVFQSFATTYTATTFDSTQKVVVVTFSDGEGSSGKGAALPLTVSGTTVSGGDKTNYTTVASYFMAATFDTTAQKSVFAFKEMSSGYPNSVTYTPPSTNATSFVGITNAAISSGATGEVAVKGGLSTTASFPTTIALGAEASLYSGTSYDRRINYDPSNNKFLAVLRTGSGGAVQVGTLSGTTMAWGTAVTFSGLSNSESDQQVSYNSNTQSFLITFPDSDNSSYPTAMVAKISGTSVTLGTRAVISSTGTPKMYLTYDSTAQKNVIGFAKNGTNYNFGIVATIDGSNNTVSFGSEQVFDTSGQNYVTGVTYDPTSNKTLFTRINNVGGVGTVGTVSGTSISFGSDTAFGTSENPYRIETVYDASAQKLISTYVGDIGSQQVKSRVATISGTSVAFGTQVTFGDTGVGSTDFSATYAPSINAILYTTSSSSTYGQITVLTSDGTNVSVGSSTQYSGVDTDYLASAFDTANSKVVVLYDVKSSNAAKYIAGDVSSAGVIGSNYFVQDDGTLATTSSTTKAGKAISTTALNLVDPT